MPNPKKLATIIIALLAAAFFIDVTSGESEFDINDDSRIGWKDVGLSFSFVVVRPFIIFMNSIFGGEARLWRWTIQELHVAGILFWGALWFCLFRLMVWWQRR
ncbi:hypothetical protein HB662_22790 [Roseomonas frigidaquae]|uniref:Transmembrane protein n=1 Tax=Falsiroseomonas frigidaquae TaxID=487318 RepID=A0ABX1F5V4_9PROT|nr:hypothetical protein [Falsiroseomonas frigidaquae]NKE47624.1 hypothetical protein [Falsiroseomonas frigidaquae]